ncbi:unnamed protein product [Amoebophrya sp. A25]|nr:unnamed protein product [Amoebophrya sp. A25]|eukprot:GSA25T00011035001.1
MQPATRMSSRSLPGPISLPGAKLLARRAKVPVVVKMIRSDSAREALASSAIDSALATALGAKVAKAVARHGTSTSSGMSKGNVDQSGQETLQGSSSSCSTSCSSSSSRLAAEGGLSMSSPMRRRTSRGGRRRVRPPFLLRSADFEMDTTWQIPATDAQYVCFAQETGEVLYRALSWKALQRFLTEKGHLEVGVSNNTVVPAAGTGGAGISDTFDGKKVLSSPSALSAPSSLGNSKSVPAQSSPKATAFSRTSRFNSLRLQLESAIEARNAGATASLLSALESRYPEDCATKILPLLSTARLLVSRRCAQHEIRHLLPIQAFWQKRLVPCGGAVENEKQHDSSWSSRLRVNQKLLLSMGQSSSSSSMVEKQGTRTQGLSSNSQDQGRAHSINRRRVRYCHRRWRSVVFCSRKSAQLRLSAITARLQVLQQRVSVLDSFFKRPMEKNSRGGGGALREQMQRTLQLGLAYHSIPALAVFTVRPRRRRPLDAQNQARRSSPDMSNNLSTHIHGLYDFECLSQTLRLPSFIKRETQPSKQGHHLVNGINWKPSSSASSSCSSVGSRSRSASPPTISGVVLDFDAASRRWAFRSLGCGRSGKVRLLSSLETQARSPIGAIWSKHGRRIAFAELKPINANGRSEVPDALLENLFLALQQKQPHLVEEARHQLRFLRDAKPWEPFVPQYKKLLRYGGRPMRRKCGGWLWRNSDYALKVRRPDSPHGRRLPD